MKNPILFPFETSSQHERKHQEQQSLVGFSEEQETSFVQGEVEKIKHKLDLKKKRQKKLRIIFGSLSGIIMFLLVVLGYFQYRLYTLSKEEKSLSFFEKNLNSEDILVRRQAEGSISSNKSRVEELKSALEHLKTFKKQKNA